MVQPRPGSDRDGDALWLKYSAHVDPAPPLCNFPGMLRLPRGVLIALEGIDGAGKTTQAAAVAVRLAQVGLEVVSSKEPTNGVWGQRIRESAITGRMSADEELHAFTEDRRAHVAELIAPALKRGAVVIVDRYYYSTAAYQGPRGFDPVEIVRTNEEFAPRPDLLAVISVPVPIGLQRIASRGDVANTFERADTLQKSAEVFAAFSGEHVTHFDGLRKPEEVTAAILQVLYRGALFRALCRKPYKDACEPAFCSFRDHCGYPEIGQLCPTGSDVAGPVDELFEKIHRSVG